MRPLIALLAVSLFKPELQGKLLQGHVSLINSLDPIFCLVSLGDTLHRPNLPLSLPDVERHAAAEALGDQWIKDESAALDGFTIPWRIMRHDEMIGRASFPDTHAALLAYVRKSKALVEALARDVDAFVARSGRSDQAHHRASEDYILEELAADIALANIAPFIHIYPGKPLEIYQSVKELCLDLPPILRGLSDCEFLRTRVRKGRVRALA